MESQNSPEDNYFTFYSFCTMNRQSLSSRYFSRKHLESEGLVAQPFTLLT